jgi:glycosyltransferase involved in cell wall biosynthesis
MRSVLPELPPQHHPMVSFITDGSVSAFARVARWLGRGFDEIGVPFDVVSVGGPPGVDVGGAIAHVRLGAGRTYRWLSPLTAYLRRARPRLALASPAYVVPFALLAGRRARTTVVPWEASMLDFELRLESVAPRMKLVPFLERFTYRWAPVAAAVSEETGRHVLHRIVRDPKKPLFVLPNPVDGEEVRRLAGAEPSRDGVFRLCAVGRLVRSKGFDVLLEALSMAAPRLETSWQLRVIGDGARREDLGRLARSLGLQDNVAFLGHLENPYPLIAAADLFVHPARWEPSSIALLEALCLGVPVLASRAPGGTREVLGDGAYGQLTTPDDSVALARSLIELVNDEDRRRELALRGPERAAAFSPVAAARRCLDLLRLVRGECDPMAPVTTRLEGVQ